MAGLRPGQVQHEPQLFPPGMSRDQHRDINIREDDTVIFSANTIPGNEVGVNDSINDLVQLGARVITNKQANTHVSGHARREELRLTLASGRHHDDPFARQRFGLRCRDDQVVRHIQMSQFAGELRVLNHAAAGDH